MGAIAGWIVTALKWLMGSATTKVAALGTLTVVLALALTYLTDLLPSWLSAAELTARFSAIPASGHLIYAWNLFQIPQGLALILSALVIRFLIRRLPAVG
ncbi:MAG: DUF2523 family protein [Gammaproteobacteria bacterium]|nr:DUF2523 family protein [Gammaproteobacteria bacterium]